jgi:hypothetical protein
MARFAVTCRLPAMASIFSAISAGSEMLRLTASALARVASMSTKIHQMSPNYNLPFIWINRWLKALKANSAVSDETVRYGSWLASEGTRKAH